MNVLAIIQARVGSTRLPGKVLLKIQDKTILQHVVDRVSMSHLVDEVIVATTIHRKDLPIVKLCSSKGIRIFCGSEEDVLDRYYQAAKLIKPKSILRITADCPVIDSEIIDQVIKKHLETGADYTGNTVGAETFPDGQDAEVFKYNALKSAWKNSELSSEREHVTQYIKKHEDQFKVEGLVSKEDLSAYRWTVDDPEDFELIKQIYDNLYVKNKYFKMCDILKLMKEKPELMEINNHIIRNIGLKKSINEDKLVKLDEEK